MNLSNLGKRIREQREKRNLKQIDIANALQISSQAVSKWERGENAPDIAILLDLSKILGVTIDWLLGGTSGDRDTFQATVFCTSVNQFAIKSNQSSPKEIALWANNLFYGLTETILQFDGIPVKYVGDGFLSFFTGPEHANRAIKAALHAKEFLNNPDLIISINSGEIYLGSIGHPNYSSKDIIGECVNNAFLALQWISSNCKTGIGLSQLTYDLIKNNVHIKSENTIQLPPSNSKVTIYEVEAKKNL